MTEEPSRKSILGAIAEDSDGEMQSTKETMTGFLRRLNHDDFLCVITHNREFVASWKQTRDHFVIKFIHKYSMAQTYAIELSFWSSVYRPKLEKDFVDRMVTPKTETNVLGLPSDMIIPESIQRKGKKNALNVGPFPKLLLEPGTHLVNASGMYLVLDRSTPGFSPHLMGDSNITEHYLVQLPYAEIENIFFTTKPSTAALDSNGLAHPSGDVTDTTTEEDENPPHLEMSSTSIDTPPEVPEDVKEEENAEEMRTKQKKDDNYKTPIKLKIKMPALAPQIGKTKEAASHTPSQSPKKGERSHVTRAEPSRISESTEAVVSNGVKEVSKDKDEAESSKGRKSRASSGSKRLQEPWKDPEIVPKDAKRVSHPTPRKRQLEEEETTENTTKRSRERSTLASPTGSKERSTAKSQSKERSVIVNDHIPATTPPPSLEKMDNVTGEPVKKKTPRGPSILEQLEEKVDEAAPLSTPLYTPSNLISLKPTSTTPRHSINPPAGMRVARIDVGGNKFVKRENGSSTPAVSRPQGSPVVIGLKPVPQEQLKKHSPKKDGKKDEKEESDEKTEEKEEKEPVIMRSRSTRAAAVKAQKETRKMKRMLAANESDEEEYLDAEEESGNEGDERAPSDDEDAVASRQENAALFGEDNDPSRVSTVEEGEVEGAADVVEIKEEVVWDDERDPDARTRNEEVLQRIAQEKANSDKAQKQLMERKERGEGVKVLERTPPVEKKEDKKDKKDTKETAVAVKTNGIACKPSFSIRNDRFFLVSMQGGDAKNGPFLMRSLAQIYVPCRDWYRSLLKEEMCLEWFPRPHIGCDGDGNVHHVSGYTLPVANPVQFNVFHLDNLFNHREYRLGEVVWAKFGKEFWPGYIKSFIPAEVFPLQAQRGDVVMIQWISEPETYNYLCYADLHHFDLYFAAIYMPAKMDKLYINNVAKAISIDGKPGYWEEHITKPVFYEMKRIGGNISSIPKEELERIELGAKAKNLKADEVERLTKNINLKEVYHFETHYRATYQGRNLNHFVPKADTCTELLSRDSIVSTKSPAHEDDDDEEEEKEEEKMPTPPPPPKRSHNKKTQRETREEQKEQMMSANGVAQVGMNPDMSSLPLFARQQVMVKVVDKTGDSRSHVTFGEASRSPVEMALDEVATGSSGVSCANVHFGVDYNHDSGARNRLNSYLSGEHKKESRKPRRGRKEDVSSAATQEESQEIVCSEITSFEVIHLKDELQVVIDPASMANDAEWQKNTQRCAAIKSVIYRHEDKRRKEHNEKQLEKWQKENEEKERLKAEQAEKSAIRIARFGTPTPLTLETVIKRSRQSRMSSEISDKAESTRETSVKRSRSSKNSETEKTPVDTPTSSRGRKRKN